MVIKSPHEAKFVYAKVLMTSTQLKT